LFQLIVTALPASSGCAASISARVIAPIEGARFVYDKKPLQKHTYVTIWENMYGEGGRAIYEPHQKITGKGQNMLFVVMRLGGADVIN
jgi:hypothetical protein